MIRIGLARLIVAVLLLGAVSPALAEPDYEAAGRHFADAQTAYAKGQFQKAAEEYDAAYVITKDPVLLYNVAEAYQKQGNAAAAVRYYRRYLQDSPTATDRADVEKRIVELEKTASATPPAPIVAPPAPRVVTPPPQPIAPVPAPPPVVKPAPASPPPATVAPPVAVIPAAPAPSHSEAVKPADTTPPPVGLLDEDRPSRTKLVAWVGVAGTVALLTAGAIFGLAAQARSDEIGRQLVAIDKDTGLPPIFNDTVALQLHDARSDGQLYDGLAIAMLTAAGVVAVVSGVLFYVDHRHKVRDTQPAHAAAGSLLPSLRIGAAVAPGHAGVTAGWGF